jgi:uncharacterized OB-fold protein
MSDTTEVRPLPQPTQASRPFWEAASEGRLMIQRCNACSELIAYPKSFCPSCMSDDLGWIESEGRGTVYTYTVQERGAPSGFADRVPYVLAVVRLAEGVQLMTNIVGEDAGETRCGDAVAVEFEEAGGVTLPVFRRVA